MSESHPTPGPGFIPPGHPRPTITPPAPHAAPHPAPSGAPKIAGVPMTPTRNNDVDLAPMKLVDEPAGGSSQSTMSKIKAFGPGATATAHTFKRQPTMTGHGAIRVRTFHGRLSDEGMQYMDDKINEWVDQHPDIEIKFVSTTIGTYEGKIREPALIVNIWY